MPRLPALKPREVGRILHRAGFVLTRQKGSHQLYVKGKHRVTVPWHNKDLKKGTLKAIITASGMTVKDFLEHRARQNTT